MKIAERITGGWWAIKFKRCPDLSMALVSVDESEKLYSVEVYPQGGRYLFAYRDEYIRKNIKFLEKVDLSGAKKLVEQLDRAENQRTVRLRPKEPTK